MEGPRVEIVELDAAATHDLRRRVLREGTTSHVVEFDGDELDGTFHLGVLRDGSLVAVSTWLPRNYPGRSADTAYQLRGMATEPHVRGTGAGVLLLEAGLERCRARGATLVWARARDSALVFYTRHGFEQVGAGYVDPTTGLPHHDVVRHV